MTVAVLDPSVEADQALQRRADTDFRVEWFSGTGKGGQHRNKHQNSCRMVHIPTGLEQSRQGRSREDNLRQAKQAIVDLLDSKAAEQRRERMASSRRGQVGSGMRGDKVRTYRFQEDGVLDHTTGRSATCSKVMRGGFDLLWRK